MMPQDQNGNEIDSSSEERQNRINRNMQKFLSTEKQQQQELLLCLRQQMPKRLRMGALTSMTVACNANYFMLMMQQQPNFVFILMQMDMKPIWIML